MIYSLTSEKKCKKMNNLSTALYSEVVDLQIMPYINQHMGHCLATPTTGSYLHKLYKRPGHCIPCGATVTE